MGTRVLYNWEQDQSVTGWTYTGGAGAGDWGTSVTPSCAAGTLEVRGSNTWWLSAANGAISADSTLYKDFSVSSFATDIDAGNATYVGDVWIATYSANNDKGRLSLEFYDGSSVIIGSRLSGAYLDPGCTWTQQTLNGTVPANTRTIRFLYDGDYVSGSMLNAYYSDGFLSISGPGIADDIYNKVTAAGLETFYGPDTDEYVRVTAGGVEVFYGPDTDEYVRVTGLGIEVFGSIYVPIAYNYPIISGIIC